VIRSCQSSEWEKNMVYQVTCSDRDFQECF